MAITANDIINEAKKLNGYKASYSSCTPNNWYYGYNVGGGTAWCAAYVCYVFHQAGADSLIPVKSANCGTLARGFYDRGQLVKSGYKAGDVVFFHWSNDSSSSVPGVYTLDHVGIIISNNGNGSYTTIEGNTGSSAYGECAIRTRYDSQISCCGRPNTSLIKYFLLSILIIETSQEWLPQVTGYNKNDANNGYAGIFGRPITGLRVSGGKQYRVHIKGGSWLPPVTGYDINDDENGYAGNGKPIDAIVVYYKTNDADRKAGHIFCANYKVSKVGTDTYYDWQLDNDTDKGQDGYAGAFGVELDKLLITIV